MQNNKHKLHSGINTLLTTFLLVSGMTTSVVSAESMKNTKTKIIANIGENSWQNIQQQVAKDQQNRLHKIRKNNQGYVAESQHGWQAHFMPNGQTQLKLGSGDQQKYIGLQLQDWGYQSGQRYKVTTPKELITNSNQLDYHWYDAITERWTNTPAGTEQWFIVNQRPAQETDKKLH